MYDGGPAPGDPDLAGAGLSNVAGTACPVPPEVPWPPPPPEPPFGFPFPPESPGNAPPPPPPPAV